jgi:hypothetical protein
MMIPRSCSRSASRPSGSMSLNSYQPRGRSTGARRHERPRRSRRGALLHVAQFRRTRNRRHVRCTDGRAPPTSPSRTPQTTGLWQRRSADRDRARYAGSAPLRRSGSRVDDGWAVRARMESGPSRSSRSAPRVTSAESSRAHPSPAASRKTVVSCAAASASRGPRRSRGASPARASSRTPAVSTHRVAPSGVNSQ